MTCSLRSTFDFKKTENFKEWCQQYKIRGVIAIHALHNALILRTPGLVYGIIFGGTDLNEYSKDAEKLLEMTIVVANAKFLVSFNDAMRVIAEKLWPSHMHKLYTIPQSVGKTLPCPSFSVPAFLCRTLPSVFPTLQSSSDAIIFLLPAGLRPVKDVCFCIPAFSEWHLTSPAVFLIIIGPEMDHDYSIQVKTYIKTFPGVYVLPALLQSELYCFLLASKACLNTSLSEGMSGVILEAMSLGVPIVARNISGNAAIVTHLENGLLFDTPQQCVSLAKTLLEDKTLSSRLTTVALVNSQYLTLPSYLLTITFVPGTYYYRTHVVTGNFALAEEVYLLLNTPRY